jgi:molybdopterin/thiamine biosynthesis adenylyltransferase
LKRLRDDGFDLEIRSAHLLVRGVPYVNSRRQIARGILVSTLTLAGDTTRAPETHIASFIGEHPCNADGSEIAQIKHASDRMVLGTDLTVDHSFSSKPLSGAYQDYYEKMSTYVAILSSPAHSIDPTTTAKTFAVVTATEEASVFAYLDTASSRAGTGGLVTKLAQDRIAIIGAGGTGSYLIDLMAKTPVREIHLFDGDRLLQHNAFRAPGAASIDQLKNAPYKVEYLKDIYSAMHRGIFAHPYNVTADNIGELAGMSFVFMSIDGGFKKKAVVEKLEELGIAFIDTGMGVELGDDGLMGLVRVTTSSANKREHFRSRVTFADAAGDDLYRNNIQIAELNALNATLAVIKWKKLRGFYLDLDREYHATYVVSGNAMINDDRL